MFALQSLRNLFSTIPLTLKMVLLTIGVGLLSWAIFDPLLVKLVRRDYQEQLEAKVNHDSAAILRSYVSHLKSHNKAAKIFVSQKGFADHITAQNWDQHDAVQTIRHTTLPAWLPSKSVLQCFPHIQLIKLSDPWGNTREIYSPAEEDILALLPELNRNTLDLAHGRVYLTSLHGRIFIITAEWSTNDQGTNQAQLVMATPLDWVLCDKGMGERPTSNQIIALIARETQTVLSSSAPSLIPNGLPIDTSSNRFTLAGDSSFSYSPAQLDVQLAAIIPTAEIEKRMQAIIGRERQNRAILVLGVILACSLLMYFVARNIRRLCHFVLSFQELELGVEQSTAKGGDELRQLREVFQNLAEEVINSHQAVKLQAREENRVISESAFDAIIILDHDNTILSWNPAAETIFGWHHHEVIGGNLADYFFAAETRQQYLEELANIVARGGGVISETIRTGQARDGSRFPMELYVAVANHETSTTVILFARDISERQRKQERIETALNNQKLINAILQTSITRLPLKQKLEQALDHIFAMSTVQLLPAGAIFLVSDDPDQLVLTASRGFNSDRQASCARIPFGSCLCGQAAAAKEIRFADCAERQPETLCQDSSPHGLYCLPIISAGSVLGAMALYVQAGHPRQPQEEEILQAIAKILAGLIELHIMEEHLEMLIGNLKSTIAELKDEKKFNESVIQSLSNGLVVLDPDGKIVACNQIGKKILAAFSSSFSGAPLASIIGPEAAARMMTISAPSAPQPDEVRLKTAKGSEMILGFTTVPWEGGGGKQVGSIISYSDITSMNYLKREMEKMNRLSTVAEIASAVAHEVRNPLAGIKTMAQAIEEQLPENDEKKEYMQRIVNQVNRLNQLLTDFFTYARPPKPRKVKTSLLAIIDETKPLIIAKLSKKQIQLSENYQEELPAILVDPNQIQQVFLNLFLNAIDAISHDHGQVTINAKQLSPVEVEHFLMTFPSLKDDATYVMVKFSDNGSGMSDEVADKVFEPFFTTKHTGTGLGLSIVYRILKENQAAIYVDTEATDATTFIMLFEADHNG